MPEKYLSINTTRCVSDVVMGNDVVVTEASTFHKQSNCNKGHRQREKRAAVDFIEIINICKL